MSHYPPNNGQPPNWQGNQPPYPPQQPWGVPPEHLGQLGQQQSQWQPGQYSQPTQAWQQPVPPPFSGGKPPRKPKKPMTKFGKISIGCFVVALLFLCGVVSLISASAHNGGTTAPPTTIIAIPSDTPTTVVQAVPPTDTPTIAPTDTPVPTPTATATPTPRPTAVPTQPIQRSTPTPTPAPHCVAVNNNPWCYNFTPGNLITNPPSAFCNYFTCVSTFWTANHGYVAECANGSYTHSGGVSGACSRDGGVSQTLYSH